MNLSNKDIYLQYALSQFLPFGEVRRGSFFNAYNCMKAYSYNGERYGYYGYDASGERTYKMGLDKVAVTTSQGGVDITNIYWEVGEMMFYPNGYINVNQNGQYTKHYYADALRIASKIGSGKPGLNLCNDAMDIDNAYPGYLGGRIAMQYEEMKEELTELVVDGEWVEDITPLGYPVFCNIGGGGYENELFFYHPDHLGSTGMVTDNNASITQGFLYAPFGEIITEYNSSWQADRIPKYSFNAKELDEENGMYYYSARYYAPPTFISRDPMFEKYPSISPYAYAVNNPLRFVDPTGRDIEGVTYDKKTKEFTYTEDAIARGTKDYIEARMSTRGGEKNIMKMINSKKTYSLNVTNKALFATEKDGTYTQVSGLSLGNNSIFISTYEFDNGGAATDFSDVMVVNADGSSTSTSIDGSKVNIATVNTATSGNNDMARAYKDSGLEQFEKNSNNAYKSRQQAIHGIGAHEERHLFQPSTFESVYDREKDAMMFEVFERKQYIKTH